MYIHVAKIIEKVKYFSVFLVLPCPADFALTEMSITFAFRMELNTENDQNKFFYDRFTGQKTFHTQNTDHITNVANAVPFKRCFFCLFLVLCPQCQSCSRCCTNSSCGRTTTIILGDLDQSVGSQILQGGYILPFKVHPILTREPLIQSGYAHAPRQILLMNALHALLLQTGSRLVQNQKPLVLQSFVSGSQTQQQMEANSGLKYPQQVPQGQYLPNGNPGVHTDLSPTGRMGHLSGLPGCVLPLTYSPSVKEVPKVSPTRHNLPVQGAIFWSINGLPIRPGDLVRPTQERWQALQNKIQPLSTAPRCRVRQFMSLIGLLTD